MLLLCGMEKQNVTKTAQEFINEKNQKNINKRISMKDISRKGKHTFEIVSWCFFQQVGLPEKVFCIERLKHIKSEGDLAYRGLDINREDEIRLSYYILGKIGNKNGKWTYGQFTPLIPCSQLDVYLKALNLVRNNEGVQIV